MISLQVGRLSTIFAILGTLVKCKQITGPVFIIEPKGVVEYSSTEGAKIDCNAYGDPIPDIKWYYKRVHVQSESELVKEDDLISVYSNGTLALHRSTQASRIRQHGVLQYMCRASNEHGTIVSTPVTVRVTFATASQRQQHAQVYDEFVIEGNTALLKCHMPTFYNNHLYVKAWIREDNFVIKANTTRGNMIVTQRGNLHIKHVTSDMNTKLGYWCQVGDRVTGETFLSETAGRLKLTSGVGTTGMPPKISDTLDIIDVMQGQEMELVCLAAGKPTPRYTWYCISINQGHTTQRKECIKAGTDTVVKKVMDKAGSYTYTCVAQNRFGRDSKTTTVVVRESLKSFIEPNYQVVNSGKEAKFDCNTQGHPVEVIDWKLNGQKLRFSDKVIKASDTSIMIKEATKDVEGMFQCFVSNKWEISQGTAQLVLGDLSPSFVQTFKSRVLQPGPSISLKCIATGRPPPNVTWSFNGGTIRQNNRFIVRETKSSNGTVNSKLIIKNIRSKDGGSYRCSAKNKLAFVSYEKPIKVYGLPKISYIEDITVAHGEDALLTCYYSGFPIESVRWIRGDGLEYLPRQATDFGNGTLKIEKAQDNKDEGEYICVVKNGRGQSDKKSTLIKILVKPKIQGFESHLQNKIGSQFSMFCSVVEGDEPVEISWLKDNQSMELEAGADIATTKMYSVLQIRQVSESDSGNYTCVAQNKAGEDTMTVQLQVLVSPKWIKSPKNTSASDGSSVTIDCTAKGFPKPTIEWVRIKDGKMTSFIFERSKHKIASNGSLILNDLNEGDQGYYSCIASNGIAPDLIKKIYLNLGNHPVIKFINESIKTESDKEIELSCQVQSDSTAQVSWLKEMDLLKNTSKMILTRYQKENRIILKLRIKNVNENDEGKYICRVSNAFGNASAHVTLKLTDKSHPDVIANSNKPELDEPTTMKFNEELTTRYISPTTEAIIPLVTTEVNQNDAFGIENSNDANKLDNADDTSELDEPLGSTKGIFEGTFDMSNILFVVPIVVIVILLIAVIVTLIVYLSARSRDNTNERNHLGSTIDRRSAKGTLDYRGNKMADKEDYYSGGDNIYRDSRYGRLERPPALPAAMPPSNRSSAAYEIPDYYSGAKPYATLQLSSRRPPEDSIGQKPYFQTQSSL